MSPEHSSTAPAPIMRELAREDMSTATQCKADGCHQQIAARVRIGGSIRPLCKECFADAVGVSRSVASRALGRGFKKSEGGRQCMSIAVDAVMAVLTGLTYGGVLMLAVWYLTELLPSRTEQAVDDWEREQLEES